MARLFVAVWLPDPMVVRIRALDRSATAGVRWTVEDQWHATLRFFGEADLGGGGSGYTVVGAVPLGPRSGG